MKGKYDVIVIGGGAAGIAASMSARTAYPNKSILVVRNVRKAVIPCAIPYIFCRLGDVSKNIIPDKIYEAKNIDLLIDTVVEIDRQNKKIKTAGGKEIGYEKLVIAVGANPFVPPIKGTDKKNVFVVKKDGDYLAEVKKAVDAAKNIVIIGGGFIGVEFADDLADLKKNVTIVEIGPHCVGVFDPEFSELVEQELKNKGIKILTNKKVVEIVGADAVEKVKLDDGTEIPADLVFIAAGVRPNVELAKKAGLKIGESGAIWVDEYMRTSDPDIFAVGDCAEKRDFFTRRPTKALLASVACAEGRIAGNNLFGLRVFRELRGTIGVFSTKVGNSAFALAGMTEKMAKKEGFDVIITKFETVDRHPGKLPGAHKVLLKLVFSRDGYLLGGQVYGGDSVGEIINIIGLAIQHALTATEIVNMQVGTHPLLTPAPTVYPLIKAAEIAASKLCAQQK